MKMPLSSLGIDSFQFLYKLQFYLHNSFLPVLLLQVRCEMCPINLPVTFPSHSCCGAMRLYFYEGVRGGGKDPPNQRVILSCFGINYLINRC